MLTNSPINQKNQKYQKIIKQYRKSLKIAKNCGADAVKFQIFSANELSTKDAKLAPYQSKNLGILKYSVPEFIKTNTDLMKIIKKIDDQTDNKNSGFFSVFLKL